MPGLSGHQVLRELRTRRRGLPVLVMSGYDEEAVIRATGDQGPAAFLQKPFRLAELADALDALLRD